MIYERRGHRLVTRREFLWRLGKHFGMASLLVIGSLGAGMAGYAWFEGLTWIDSFLNAAMLLGGMGPITAPVTPGGKIFAGIYALYAGLLFLIGAGLIFAPVIHRILHHFHMDEEKEGRR